MTYRNILVQVDETTSSNNRIAAAIGLAKRFDCALTGAFLRSEFLALYGTGDAIAFMPPEGITLLIDQQTAAVGKAAAAARAMFETAARKAGIPFEWVELAGDNSDDMIGAARRHDLTIFPPDVTVSLGRNHITAGELGIASGAPVLIVPRGAIASQVGKRVLIAWKGSRESARALNDAWPFLKEADEVLILTINQSDETVHDPMLERQFRLHGCKPPKFIYDKSEDASTAEVLLRHIGTSGVDLVVMGLYGHARIQELALGGVSRELLARMPVPLLASH